MKKLVVLFALLSEIISAYAQPTFITDSPDRYITREMQRWNIPAVAIAIVKNGKVTVSIPRCHYESIPDRKFAIKVVPFLFEEGKVKQMTLACNVFIDFMPYDFVKVQRTLKLLVILSESLL